MDKTKIGDLVERKRKVIGDTDPDRIYPENVRSFFHLPHSWAVKLCDLAVREGFFEKRVAVVCPNSACGRVIETFAADEPLPEHINCWTCEADEQDQHTFSINEVDTFDYYRLINRDAIN